ncbi:MAG: hypothetical protein HC853_02150 [Anaerolineae bacterium]|nr:hypothetical protein [Anaerolineae bacterium]
MAKPLTRFERALCRAHRRGRLFVSEAARVFCVDHHVISGAVRRHKLTAVREDHWLTVRRCEVLRYVTKWRRCNPSRLRRRRVK